MYIFSSKNYSFIIASSCLLAQTLAFASYIQVSGNEIIPPGSGISTIGAPQIFDLRADNCIAYDGVESVSSGAEMGMEVKLLSSTAEWNQTVKRTLGASISDLVDKIKLFGGTGRLKSLLQETRSETTSVAYINIRKSFGANYLKNPRISSQALRFIGSGAKNDFFKLCGDSFVVGYRKISEAHGYIHCHVQSESLKEVVDQSIKAQGVIYGMGISGSATQLLDRLQKMTDNNCFVSMSSKGGSGSITLKNPEDFSQSVANHILNATQETGWIDGVYAKSYTELNDNEIEKLLQSKEIIFSQARDMAKNLVSHAGILYDLFAQNPSEVALNEIEKTVTALKKCSRNPEVASNCRILNDQLNDINPF